MNVSKKFGMWEGIYSGVQQGLILAPLSFNVFISDIFIFLATCNICNYADNNTLYADSKNLHQIQKYLKKDFENLENWSYNN